MRELGPISGDWPDDPLPPHFPSPGDRWEPKPAGQIGRPGGSNGSSRGLFSAEAAADYSRALGREVRVDEIQPAVNELLAANLIMRRSHGVYGITDPFVQDAWLEKKRLTETP
jgi:hypothetical protein